MPPPGFLIGGVDFSSLAVPLKAATVNAPAVPWKYGKFLQTVADFLIIASNIFQEVLLAEIGDLLKTKS